MFSLTVSLMITACSPWTAGGQSTSDSLGVGTRIRVRAAAAGIPWPAIGVADSVRRDTLFASGIYGPHAFRARQVVVPIGTIERLEMSVHRASRFSRAGRGALWGLAIYGVLAGAYIAGETITCDGAKCFNDGWAWMGLAGGVPLSASVGAAIGFVLPAERWRDVQLQRRGIRP
jgi:hypothetical protein